MLGRKTRVGLLEGQRCAGSRSGGFESTYLVPLDYSLCHRVGPKRDHVNCEASLHACHEQWPVIAVKSVLECGLETHAGNASQEAMPDCPGGSHILYMRMDTLVTCSTPSDLYLTRAELFLIASW